MASKFRPVWAIQCSEALDALQKARSGLRMMSLLSISILDMFAGISRVAHNVESKLHS